MGIALLFISVLLFACSMIFIQSGLVKHLWVAGSVILLVVVSVILILNDTEHFGMKQVDESQEQSLLSSSKNSKSKKLFYKNLGNGKEKIYYYRTSDNDPAKLKKTDPMTTQVRVKRSSSNKLKVVKKYWVYTNDFAKLFFAGGQPNHQFIEQHFTFQVDENWKILQRK